MPDRRADLCRPGQKMFGTRYYYVGCAASAAGGCGPRYWPRRRWRPWATAGGGAERHLARRSRQRRFPHRLQLEHRHGAIRHRFLRHVEHHQPVDCTDGHPHDHDRRPDLQCGGAGLRPDDRPNARAQRRRDRGQRCRCHHHHRRRRRHPPVQQFEQRRHRHHQQRRDHVLLRQQHGRQRGDHQHRQHRLRRHQYGCQRDHRPTRAAGLIDLGQRGTPPSTTPALSSSRAARPPMRPSPTAVFCTTTTPAQPAARPSPIPGAVDFRADSTASGATIANANVHVLLWQQHGWKRNHHQSRRHHLRWQQYGGRRDHYQHWRHNHHPAGQRR